MTLPTPTYQDELVTIYNADCLELLDQIQADVLVTDPPYGMKYESGYTKRLNRAIANDADTSVRDKVLLKWEGPALVFGRWSETRPSGVHTRLIWDKQRPGMGNLAIPWGPSDEEIYVIGKGFNGNRQSNVLRFDRCGLDEHQAHPTPKPLDLMQHLISRCPDGVIVDPFMGSGSTLVACKALGRKAVGIELEPHYCEIAAERCRQGYLFGQPTA